MVTAAAPTRALTQVEFEGADFPKAEAIAAALGYEQFAYTSTSALWGLFCLPENPATAAPGQATTGGCIIKTPHGCQAIPAVATRVGDKILVTQIC